MLFANGVACLLELFRGVIDRSLDVRETLPDGVLDLVELLHRVNVDLAHFSLAAFLELHQHLLALLHRFLQDAILGDEILRA